MHGTYPQRAAGGTDLRADPSPDVISMRHALGVDLAGRFRTAVWPDTILGHLVKLVFLDAATSHAVSGQAEATYTE